MTLPFVRHAPTLAAPSLLTPPASPQGQYLADALDQLQSQAPTTIRTAGALGTNLLADALLHYGLNRRRDQDALQRAYADPNSLVNDPEAMASMAGLY